MSTVPGTFKNRPPALRRDLSPDGVQAERLLLGIGALSAERWLLGGCTVMVCREPLEPNGGYRWHLSIAHPSRYPTWDEIKTAVFRVGLPADVVMAQAVGPGNLGPWVNLHDNCFHLYEIRDEAFRPA